MRKNDEQTSVVKKRVGRNIRWIRENLAPQYSQEEFANKYDLTGATLSGYENGNTWPSYSFLLQLKKDYDFLIDDLFGDNFYVEKLSKEEDKDLKKYEGVYCCFLLKTDKHKAVFQFDAEYAVRYGVITISRNENIKDTGLEVNAWLNLNEDKMKEIYKICVSMMESDHSIPKKEVAKRLGSYLTPGMYYRGQMLLSKDNLFMEISSGEKDRAYMIFRVPTPAVPKYIGGIGTINSVSKGEYALPCIQNICISKYCLCASQEQLLEHLSMKTSITEESKLDEDMIQIIEKLYCREEISKAFSEEDRRCFIRAVLKRYTESYILANLFRTEKITVDKDNAWYHFIKKNQEKRK